MNPYKKTHEEIRRMTEISIRTGIPVIMPSNPCSEVSARDMINPHDSMRRTPLEDPGHVVDPKERSPIYVDVAMWQVMNGPSAKEMREGSDRG